MTTSRITAKFIGKDGSLGYRHGQTYRLRLVPSRWPVAIRRTDGTGFCPYSSQAAFERNWTVLPPDSPEGSIEQQEK